VERPTTANDERGVRRRRYGVAMPPARRILGVDPGTRVTGWAVLEHAGNRSRLVACGAVATSKGSVASRLHEVHAALRDVVREHRPATLAVERQFFGKNAATAFVTGMARGAALVVAGEAGLDVHEYPPATVKKAVVGNGNASKAQVASMVRILLGLAALPEPEDVTDALAVALADAHRTGLRGIEAPPGAPPDVEEGIVEEG
jgi:crossover junction endodeoxyribonuclease RuvC